MALTNQNLILVYGSNAQTFTTLEELKEFLGGGEGGGVTQDQLDTQLAAYAKTATMNSELTKKADKTQLTKAGVGLGNVDNTADAAKPVSTAQKAAIDKKQDIPAGTPKEGSTLEYIGGKLTYVDPPVGV